MLKIRWHHHAGLCCDYCTDSRFLTTQDGLTALIVATQNSHTDVIAALVDAKADPNIIEKVCVIISHLYIDNSIVYTMAHTNHLCYATTVIRLEPTLLCSQGRVSQNH